MNKETSSAVSTIASRLVRTTGDDLWNSLTPEFKARDPIQVTRCDTLAREIRTLAASCLSQDEHKGQTEGEDLQNFGDVLFRLKHERDELEHKLISLNSFLHHNRTFPAPNHRDMLARQSTVMSEYLSILDERIADLEITRRSDITAENVE